MLAAPCRRRAQRHLAVEACLLQPAVDVVEFALCLLRVDGECYGFDVVVIHKKKRVTFGV